MVGISLICGLAQLTLYVFKFYRNTVGRNYRTNDTKTDANEIASNRDNQVTLKKHTLGESNAWNKFVLTLHLILLCSIACALYFKAL